MLKLVSLAAALMLLGSAQAADADAARQILMHAGVERTYVARNVERFSKSRERVPLVLVLHGGGGNAANAERMTGFTEKARKEGFIVVYPEGSGSFRTSLLTWNAGHCCGYAMKHDVDDVGFIRALIDELTRRYPIDANRIHVTGMSNGGMMTHRLGIDLSDRIASIAPVVATVFGDEKKPRHPISALMINGALDKHVPHTGGPPGGRGMQAWDGTPTRPALAQAEFWAAANGCSKEQVKEDAIAWTSWRYDCPSSRAVQLYLLEDNGHAWPGGEPGSRRGDKPSTSLNATDVIWDFFMAHPRSLSASRSREGSY
jgi:polyhydroxybutyrate depolymerase